MTNTKLLLQILTQWALENKEYELLFRIYTMFNLGIPNKFLYQYLPKYNHFNSFDSFVNNIETRTVLYNQINSSNYYLRQLLETFKHNSKYTTLPTWNNFFGYLFTK